MTFYQLFILACFNSEQPMRTSTLYHLLKGKRTSSVLSYGHFYQCLIYFALFPKLEEKSYQAVIKNLIEKELILEVGNGYAKLSPSGKLLLTEATFPKTNNLKQLAFYKWDIAFFERIVFTTQVLSEKAHENTHYLPIETNLFKQQQLKKWLKKQNKEVSNDFYHEWEQLIEILPKESHELILGQLVGFEQIGLTLNQLADKKKLDYLFNYIEFKNAWHQVIQNILESDNHYPLFKQLLLEEIQLKKEDSSRLSSELAQKGYSIEKIAQMRKLKISTITDHLIEEYLLTKDSDKIPTFSNELEEHLEELRKDKPLYLNWTYQEALTYYPAVSFYEFKFYQFYLIEKERSK